MTDQPQYLLFAGINGAGKSTLFKSGLWKNDSGNLVESTSDLVSTTWHEDILRSVAR